MTVSKEIPRELMIKKDDDPNLRVFGMSATVTDPEAFLFADCNNQSVKYKKLNSDEVVQVYNVKVQDRWRVSNVLKLMQKLCSHLNTNNVLRLNF